MSLVQDDIAVIVFDRDDSSKFTRIDNWQAYEVHHSVWQDCGRFSLTPSPTKEIRELFRYPGQIVSIWANQEPQMVGIVDEVSTDFNTQGGGLTVTGRDMGGLLVDSAAPRMSFSGLTFGRLLQTLVGPWSPGYIKGITTNNAVNFYRMVGHKGKRKVIETEYVAVGTSMDSTTGEQSVVHKKHIVLSGTRKVTVNGASFPLPELRTVTWKVQGGKNSAYFAGFDEPQTKRIRGGERVMDVIKDIAQSIACFVQMTCDQWLCVAKPRYDEKPYGKLVFQMGQEGHVKAVSRKVGIGERFSIYLANSRYRRDKSDKGLDASYKYWAHDPSPAFFKWSDDGESLEERLYKPTILEAKRGGRNATMLRRLVRRKMEEAMVKGSSYEWQLMGHRDPASGLLYAPDACVEVQDEMHDLIGDYYITDRTLRKDLNGTGTVLRLIPAGIWLVDSDSWTDAEYSDYMHWKADF